MTAPASPPASVWELYWDALSDGAGDRAVEAALGWFESGAGLVDVLDGLVAPGQARVGAMWAANEWNVAQEHRATSVSEEVLAALGTRIEPRRDRGQAVVTCVDGEWHALPSRMVALVLREAGWQVHFLGASVPVPHLSQFLQDTGPDVTALSCSLPTALPRARQMIEASRQVGVPVIAGGAGFGPGGRWALKLGANGAAAHARGALATLASESWPSFTGAAPPLETPDRSAEDLWRRRRDLVGLANRKLEQRWPAMRRYDDRQRERTEEDLSHLVEFLAAALFVDDVTLYTDFVGWLGTILESRGVHRAALTAGLEVTGEAVAEAVGPQPRVERFIGIAVAAV